MVIITETKTETTIPGVPHPDLDGWWLRTDRVLPRWGDPYVIVIACDGPTDDSAQYTGARRETCPLCHLARAHSQRLHDHHAQDMGGE